MNHEPGSAWSHLFLHRPSAFRHPLAANQAHKRQNQTPNQQLSTLLNFFQRGEEGNFHVGSQFQWNGTFEDHDRGPRMGPIIPNSRTTNKASTAECAAPQFKGQESAFSWFRHGFAIHIGGPSLVDFRLDCFFQFLQ